jgi:phosphate transport system ATP-binding protein
MMQEASLRAPAIPDFLTRARVVPEARPVGPDEGNALQVAGLGAWYSSFRAVKGVTMPIARHRITSIIGPSGCGKSTLIRCLNRMNDLTLGFHVEGQVLFDNGDLYGRSVDPVEVRRRIGMVFQKPNPFPKSIFENVAFGRRIHKLPGNMNEAVERALRQAALWDDVKDKLDQSALSLSGGQQQRLCIARCIAVEPEILLMDEPCSALDPIATLRIEELMHQLVKTYTIAIVTHNMEQAARVSDFTAVMMMADDRAGELIEFGPTREVFLNPSQKQTEAYITGRLG